MLCLRWIHLFGEVFSAARKVSGALENRAGCFGAIGTQRETEVKEWD